MTASASNRKPVLAHEVEGSGLLVRGVVGRRVGEVHAVPHPHAGVADEREVPASLLGAFDPDDGGLGSGEVSHAREPTDGTPSTPRTIAGRSLAHMDSPQPSGTTKRRITLDVRRPLVTWGARPTVTIDGVGHPAQWGSGTWAVAEDGSTEVGVYCFNRLWRFGAPRTRPWVTPSSSPTERACCRSDRDG